MKPRQDVLAGATRHECPVPGCSARVRPGLMMCGAHWGKVTPTTQGAVYEAWNRLRRGERDGVGAYRSVKAQAVAEATAEAA